MGNNLVTVFIPVFNAEEFLSEALESILKQTYQNIEILLVDDGSTDRSIDIIHSFDDERIRLIQNGENRGIPYTRNVGLREAKGEYMIIMDADDIALPKRIERQVDYLEKHPDIDALGTYYFKFGGKITRKFGSSYQTPEEIRIMLLFFNPIANPSSAVRLNTLREHQLSYNPDYFVAQDYELWARLSKVGRLSILPEYLLKYRSGHENITKKSKLNKQQKRRALIGGIREDLLQHYNIHLTEKELAVYNDFFTTEYSLIEDTDTLIAMIRKLVLWNEETKTFDSALFLGILEDNVIKGITNQRVSLKKKFRLYSRMGSHRKLRNYLLIAIKHFYHRVN